MTELPEKYRKKIDEIANNPKLFREIQPERVVVLNAKGRKEMDKFLDDMFRELTEPQ
jgi:hypothetical protein